MRRFALPATMALPVVVLLSACTQNTGPDEGQDSGGRTIAVTSSDDACEL